MKPPYKVPSMAQIRRARPNGYTVVSTFSGCGGSCLGFRMAGFRTLWASEFVPAAADSYAANFPRVPLDRRDVREVDPAEILARIGLGVGDVDVLEGSPPCADFSTAGKRHRSWGVVKPYSDTRQRTDDLFWEYVRILRGLMPRAFVAENVSGLVKGVAKGYFKEILAELKGSGYRVQARLLDAQWLGVPQSRQRIIFVGAREDLGVEPAHPLPLPHRYSVRDALPQIGGLRFNTGGRTWDGSLIDREVAVDSQPSPAIRANRDEIKHYQVRDHDVGIEHSTGFNGHAPDSVDEPARSVQASRIVRVVAGRGRKVSPDEPAPTVQTHGRRRTRSELSVEEEAMIADGASIEDYAIGAEWERLRPGEASERYFNLVRADPDRPSPTVTQTGHVLGAAAVTHPTEKRKFSIPELKRICAFPDDFKLTGTYAQQWERLGRAVPPLMMRAVAETVRDEVLRKADGR